MVLCVIMIADTPTEQAQELEETRERGHVKWFNNRAGYGFITASEGDKKGDDVFVHHTALRTKDDQYKYLVQGEYIEFEWVETSGESDHKWQAGNVKGVDGGSLMCETRNNSKQNHSITDSARENRRRTHQNKKSFRTAGGERTFRDDDGCEWMLVRKKSD